MAQYKYTQILEQSNHAAYDLLHEPGEEAADAGIYRCRACGHEIGIAKGHRLPPQNHHQHAPALGRIQWQLAVFAQAK